MPAPKGNKNAVGNKGGRPRIVPKEELPELATRMLSFFQKAYKEFHTTKRPVFLTTFSIDCGIDIDNLKYYTKDSLEFSDVYKKCKMIVEEILKQGLALGYFTPGPGIFIAKNETDMRDEHHVKSESVSKIMFEISDTRPTEDVLGEINNRLINQFSKN